MTGSSRWPAAVEALNLHGGSPVVLLCPHASNYIPSEYEKLRLHPAELERHIAWDIGAAGVTRRLCQLLDAPAFLGTYSRLLIDLNRPLQSAASIVARSEDTDIPGNIGITTNERARRTDRIFYPFHRTVKAHLAERERAASRIAIVAIHSFTPVYRGIAREWHAGVLFEGSKDFGFATLERMRNADNNLIVDANVPYQVTPDDDFALLVYGDEVGNPAIEFEIRQDLIAEREQQECWAQCIATTLALDVAFAR